MTAPASIVTHAGISGVRALQGRSDAGEPISREIEGFVDFNKRMAELGSAGLSEKEARKRIQEEAGLTSALVVAPFAVKGVRGRKQPHLRRRGSERKIRGVVRRRQDRRQVSERVAEERGRLQLEEARHERDVVQQARKAKGSSKVRRTRDVEPANVVGFLAEHGGEKGLPAARKHYRENVPRVEPEPGRVTAHDVLDYLDENPEVLRDPELQKAVGAYRKVKADQPSRDVPRYAPVMQSRGRKGVEARVEAKERGYKEAKSKLERQHRQAKKRVDRLRGEVTGREAQGPVRGARRQKVSARKIEPGQQIKVGSRFETVKSVKRDGNTIRVTTERGTTRELTPGQSVFTRQTERAVTGRRREQLREAEAEVAATKAALKKLRQQRRTRSQFRREAESEYVTEGKRIVAEEGLDEPVIFRHSDVISAPKGATGGSSMPRTAIKTHRRRTDEGSRAARGRVDYSVEALRESLNLPARTQSVHRATMGTVKQGGVPVREGETRPRAVPLSEVAPHHRKGGRLPPDKVVLVPIRMVQAAVRDADANAFDQAIETTRRALDGDVDAIQKLKGEKVIAVERHIWDEQTKQLAKHGDIAKGYQTASRTISKAILHNPAWATSQVFAAAATALFKAGPTRLARATRTQRQLSPKAKETLGAAAGQVPGSAATPKTRLTIRPEEVGRVSRGWARLHTTPAGRFLARAIDAPSAFNKWSEGQVRQAALLANVDKQLNGWVAGMRSLARNHRDFYEQAKGLSRAEQAELLARNPKVLRDLTRDTLDVTGNFSALTRFEQVVAPALIFYPFMRMSARFLTYGLPGRHPVKAALSWQLAQWNANELHKFFEGDPGFFAEWASILVKSGKDGQAASVLPLVRIAPGGSYLPETLGTAASEGKGLDVLRAANPVVGGTLAAATGVDPLTGKQLKHPETGQPLTGATKESIRLGLSVVFGAPAPVRLASQVFDLQRKDLLRRKDRNALYELNRKLRPKDQAIIKGFAAPAWLVEADKAHDQARLSQAFRLIDKGGESKTEGQAILDGLYEKHGLAAQAKRESKEFFAKRNKQKPSSPWSKLGQSSSPWSKLGN